MTAVQVSDLDGSQQASPESRFPAPSSGSQRSV
jgi:hypothetical protein